MFKMFFGTKNQVQFNNVNDFYEFLGYLAKSDGTTSLVWEDNQNQGAWGSEVRIHFYTSSHPYKAVLKQTKGTGSILSRVNCNEFVKNLYDNYNFIRGKTQNASHIKTSVPPAYHADFDRGLKL